MIISHYETNARHAKFINIDVAMEIHHAKSIYESDSFSLVYSIQKIAKQLKQSHVYRLLFRPRRNDGILSSSSGESSS